jgi:hypothetical protein
VSPSLLPVRFSNLKAMSRSPAHYVEGLKGRDDTAALRLGRLVDLLVFLGEDTREPVIYDGTRRGKAWDAFEAEHAGADIFTASELLNAQPIVESLMMRPEHSYAQKLLCSGTMKHRVGWSWLGRECSGEPDVAGRILVDLKTTRDAEPGRFMRDAMWRAYHAQLAWYRQGLILSGAQPPAECYIVAVEISPPYPVTVLRLTERTLTQGERLCRLWMERLLSCEASGSWPGYVQTAVEWDMPEELQLTGFDDDTEAA